MTTKQKNATLADVARLVGVSAKTVSRVVNNSGYVGSVTRRKILEAVAELDYHPNRAARSLVSNRSYTIGLTIPDITNPFFPELIRGVELVAMEHEYNVLIYNTSLIGNRDRQVLTLLEENRVDGVIVCSMGIDDTALSQLLERQSASVLVNRVLADGCAGMVRVDFSTAMGRVTQHLLDAGRRHIGYLSIPNHDVSYSATERFKGFQSTLERNGLAVNPQWVRRCRATVDDSFRAASSLLQDHPELDAIICFNDLIASGTLEACIAHDIAVPERVAVTGFDNVMFSSLLKIPLTTVHVPKQELGVRAAVMLFGLINDQAVEREVVLEAELLVRQSAP